MREAMDLVRRSIARFIPRTCKGPLLHAYHQVAYMGTGVHCPVCDRSFRSFINSEDTNDFLCPGCMSHSRHRLLLLYLKQRTTFFKDELKVLHFAPELYLQKRFRA